MDAFESLVPILCPLQLHLTQMTAANPNNLKQSKVFQIQMFKDNGG